MEALRFEATGVFGVAPRELWPLLADTARLNRALGLPPVEFEITPLEGGGSRVEAAVRVLGLTVARYTEHPFRWAAPFGYLVVRDFHGGPFRRARVGAELTPRNGETEVRYWTELLPRNRIGGRVARFIGPRGVRRVLEQCRVFERYALGEAEHPFPQLAAHAVLPEPAASALAGLGDGGDLLRRHLAEAPDEEVVKMRPFELADRWGLDRRETLALFLRATTAGLLVMSWDVLCPNCRIGKAEYSRLRDLAEGAHCETCNIRFDAAFDRSIEVRFSAATAPRRVKQREYCVGGPMQRPHVLAQARLEPGEASTLRPYLAAGRYRLRSDGMEGRALIQASGPEHGAEPTGHGDRGDHTGEPAGRGGGRMTGRDAMVLRAVIRPEGFDPVAAEVGVGVVEMEVRNETERAQLVGLEREDWPDTVATAALVSTLQEFRDLFSSEALAPGLELGVESLGFLFTDLTGSTALYQAIGQARAFRLVQDHFRVLGAAITASRGALVKTIGDAVMAVFPDGAGALAAALRIQRDIRAMEAPPEVDTARLVKAGVHQGACLAVTLNDRLDYFGTTVNVAARVEHEASGGQVVATLAACRSEAAARLLADAGAGVEEDVVHLRGIAEPVPVYRISPGVGAGGRSS